MRRYADVYPTDVPAMVLLDPPGQDIAEFSPEFQKAEDEDKAAGLEGLRACVKAADDGKFDKPTPELKNCLRGPNPHFSDALKAAQRASKLKPAFWHTLLSVEETNTDLFKQPVSTSEKHGAIPILILAPNSTNADAPRADRKAFDAASMKTHQLIAATSTTSKIIPVAHSTHDVQFDRPDTVISAVTEAVNDVKAKTKTSLK